MAETEQQVCSFFLQGKCKRKKACPFAHPIIEVAAAVADKPKVEKKVVEKPKKTPLELANEEVTELGDRVRELKAKKAAKPEVDAAVAKLLEAKNKVKALGGDAAGGKADDKKKGKEAPKAVGGGVKSDKKQKKKKGEEEDEEEESAETPAAATPAPAAEKPAAKTGGDKKGKGKKEEAAPAATEAAPAAEKSEKKEKGGKKAKEAAAPAAAAEKPASRKVSSADEPAKKAAEKPASRKVSSADEPVAKKAAEKPASRKVSAADDTPAAAKGKAGGSRKTSNADEAKGGKKSRSNSNLVNEDEKSIKAAQRAPVDLNDPFLLKYKTFSDSPVLGKAAPSLDGLKYLGEAKAPGRDAPLAVLFWSVYYTGGYKFLPLYSDLLKTLKGKVNIIGVSIDPDIAAPKKWIEDPDKKFSKGEFPTSIPLAYDEGKKVYEQFRGLLQNTLNIPHLFLVDKKGVIVWHQDHSQIGGTCYDWMDMIERQIKALLAGKALETFGPSPVEEEEAEAEEVSGSFDPNDLF